MPKILLRLGQALEKEMGERRLTFHRPCGISVLPKLDVDGIVGGTGARWHVTCSCWACQP